MESKLISRLIDDLKSGEASVISFQYSPYLRDTSHDAPFPELCVRGYQCRITIVYPRGIKVELDLSDEEAINAIREAADQ
jgi:hypothetical protein